MSYRLPQPGEVWQFRHLPREVEIVGVIGEQVQYRYLSSGTLVERSLVGFVQDYRFARTVDDEAASSSSPASGRGLPQLPTDLPGSQVIDTTHPADSRGALR